MTPIYGFLEGDTIGLLILADESGPVARLAEQIQTSARVRLRPKGAVKVIHNGRVLDPRKTLQQVGIKLLDRVDVVEDVA